MFYDEKFALLLQCKLQLFSKHKKGNLYIEFEVNFVVEVPPVFWHSFLVRFYDEIVVLLLSVQVALQFPVYVLRCQVCIAASTKVENVYQLKIFKGNAIFIDIEVFIVTEISLLLSLTYDCWPNCDCGIGSLSPKKGFSI